MLRRSVRRGGVQMVHLVPSQLERGGGRDGRASADGQEEGEADEIPVPADTGLGWRVFS